MWTEKLIIGFVLCFVLSLSAQQSSGNYKKTKRRPATQKTTQEIKSPSEPSIKKHDVEYVLKRYREMIIDNKWPQNIQGVYLAAKQRKKNNRRIGDIESDIFLNKLRKIVLNPDLEEVMGIRKSWFVSIGKLAAQFDRITKKVTVALDGRNEARYRAAIAGVPAIARQLESLLAKPEKIPAKEWNLICEANYNRRLKEYYKKTQEQQKQ